MPQNFKMTGSERVGSPRSTVTKQLDQPIRMWEVGGLTDVLDDVVSKGVLNKLKGMGSDPLDQLHLLKARSVVNAPLKNAATMAMSSNRDAVFSNGIEDELVEQLATRIVKTGRSRCQT